MAAVEKYEARGITALVNGAYTQCLLINSFGEKGFYFL